MWTFFLKNSKRFMKIGLQLCNLFIYSIYFMDRIFCGDNKDLKKERAAPVNKSQP